MKEKLKPKSVFNHATAIKVRARVKTKKGFNFPLMLEKWLSWHLMVVKPKGLALRDLKPLLNFFTKVWNTKGKEGLIILAKISRTNLLNYLSGNPVRLKGVKLTASGIPVFLGPRLIKAIIDKDPVVLRFVLTVLFSTRSLKTKASPDIETITDPLKKGASWDGISLFMGDFWRTLGYTHKGVIPRSLRFRSFHFTTKSGPNGHALSSWVSDLRLLPKQLIESIKYLGGEVMEKFLDTALDPKNASILDDLVSLLRMKPGKIKQRIIRKISYFADKEGKTRVIAIGDYFSQTVLKQLHTFLYRALKKIPQDCTFDQGRFKERMKGCKVYYSADLSAATDRFPIQLIKLLLAALLPTEYAQAWEHIMIGYPFEYNKTKEINYAVGNPMGFYSSWASFALVHHYIIYYCCRVLGKSWKDLPYALLGDDIVIGDQEVGEYYLKVMANLGVEISTAKSHISSDLYEFAKRLIYKGTEISPFPYSALKMAGRSNTALATLLISESAKGWVFSEGIGSAVSSYLGIVKSLPSRVKSKGALDGFMTEQIIGIIWGSIPAGEAMTSISRKFSNLNHTFNDSTSMNILANIMVDFFSQSNEALLSKKGKPLGLLATEMVMYLTGSEKEDALTLLKNPHLDCYGSIEQTYIDLLRKAREVDTIHSGEWPLLLKAITIPLSDELFVNRQTEVTRVAVSKVGKALVERLKILESYPSLLQ